MKTQEKQKPKTKEADGKSKKLSSSLKYVGSRMNQYSIQRKKKKRDLKILKYLTSYQNATDRIKFNTQ